MNKSNFYMIDLTVDTQGNDMALANFRLIRAELTEFAKNNEITLYELNDTGPFILSKEDAVLLKLAGFSMLAKTIEDLVNRLIQLDHWEHYNSNVIMIKRNAKT